MSFSFLGVFLITSFVCETKKKDTRRKRSHSDSMTKDMSSSSVTNGRVSQKLLVGRSLQAKERRQL